MYSAGSTDATSVRIRVALGYGPDDRFMPDALGQLARGLKQRLREEWFRDLEFRILKAHGSDSTLYAKAAEFRAQSSSFVTIHPNGSAGPP